MTFQVAVVQPRSHSPAEAVKNVPDAVAEVEAAAAKGAHFITFPESYPGPWQIAHPFDPIPSIAEAAKRAGIHVVFGTIEPINHVAGTAHNLVCMAYPDGTVVKYRRTHPNGPWIYTGGGAWEFQYQAGHEFPVFQTEHGVVGLAMCSEVYMPEVARALALRGAEIIFMPAGTNKRRLWDTWRTLIWARAIENLAVVITSQNMLSEDDRGMAMVATPEAILFESEAAGTTLVEVSLERVRELRRTNDSVGSSASYGAKQGVLGPQWQRPELYETFYPPPRAAAAE